MLKTVNDRLKQRQAIYDLYKKGWSTRKIAKELTQMGLPITFQGVSYIIKHDKYNLKLKTSTTEQVFNRLVRLLHKIQRNLKLTKVCPENKTYIEELSLFVETNLKTLQNIKNDSKRNNKE